ncbi:MAG TPA: single-stranded-DNA-specific exonuclease RecJ [Cyanobacteria bacterium UBA11149]|nr:single-stranded-DNA-specific exonuclease RecJ [Cyanobacteria bacterium UBA11367]HBE58781.1 single-stranded-DNA-specific exonuclease RecJ [Cyanobacteria bacterium UBA11366]HBK64589.1 single-stranded-DNA-specific exonuclease RecJ [Cyanobacteria bacterium UBA11166]HBR76730.1 single-stranded-DNA-specific exonuclease RecJ [Cyanobacteria bacterium UBA11159]HBS69229.1 single-stranded-DNA-specific exonuclease RecJ [Cyanobacteria bacterium UBA11153]HBW89947.1 single-stranded-DNA-specific exonuclease
MSQPQPQWQIQPTPEIPQWFLETIKHHIPNSDGRYAAQLLWQRGIQNPQQLAGFLNPELYQPTNSFEFGQDMKLAVRRLQKAREIGEKVAIWGDFDADGITATSILWEGLGQFFTQHQQLTYYIPNRITESHGLNNPGIDKLADWGAKLIVTCDTGSTNLAEIEHAQSQGIDIIITDHHTLPEDRPPVISIINPRYFIETHPLFHLSGVAVAYKLVEALYKTLPDIPQKPVENLLDLVAIGLIADLVQLNGDCRYLAQKGIQKLQQQTKTRSRPGVAKLLELCQRNGDRPTDISFGIGPRINAVSRIQGDASFCVELLTSRDEKRTNELALFTELANSRRKSLQKDVSQQVKQKLTQLDLSTTSVIVLEDPQWAVGVLGLVAGEIAQEYGLPTILLSSGDREMKEIEETQESQNISLVSPPPTPHSPIARGSARSINNIDLYELVNSQAHLLHRFGGHPFAAGLSLPVENIPLFTDAINQQLRQKLSDNTLTQPVIKADIVVTVPELGKELFQELKLLEPCGMGNPVPKLLIENCWFQEVWNRNTQDLKGSKIQYIKTELEVWDDFSHHGFPGIWWGHYKDEVPKGRCSCLVELDYNNYKKRPEIRIIAIHSQETSTSFNLTSQIDWILDWRGEDGEIGRWGDGEMRYNLSDPNQSLLPPASHLLPENHPLTIRECPMSWDEIQLWYRRAIQTERKLAIAYPPPNLPSPEEIWHKLVGIAKFLSRTGQAATLAQLQEKLNTSDRTLHLGFLALESLGFQVKHLDWAVEITWNSPESSPNHHISEPGIQTFLAAVEEEQFLRQYFYQVPLSTIERMVAPIINHSNC